MTLYDIAQAGIVGGAVLGSALYALGRVAPRLKMRIGERLLGSRHRAVSAVGLRLAGNSGGGCGGGCSSCGGCAVPDGKQPAPSRSAK